MKNIYEYTDYRDFLKDRFFHLKSNKKSISMESIARKVGISRGYFNLVLHKKRHLGLDNIKKLSVALLLNKIENEYLVFFICYSIVQDDEIRSFFKVICKRLENYIKNSSDTNLSFLNDFTDNNSLDLKELILSIAEYANLDDENWIINNLEVNIPREIIISSYQEIIKNRSLKDQLRRYNQSIPYNLKLHPTKTQIGHFLSESLIRQAQYSAHCKTMGHHLWNAGFLLLDEKSSNLIHQEIKRHTEEIAKIISEVTEPDRVYSYICNAIRVAGKK